MNCDKINWWFIVDAIVMLNYNCSNLVLKAIDTFKKFKNKIEFFVVDNNSNEENKNILKHYEENKDDFKHHEWRLW